MLSRQSLLHLKMNQLHFLVVKQWALSIDLSPYIIIVPCFSLSPTYDVKIRRPNKEEFPVDTKTDTSSKELDTVWLECYAGKFFLLKLHTPTHISLESLYKAGHDEIVNGAIKHL